MPLTCLACKLLFSVPQLHHDHYKTDWHRYNLKRQIAELPPLSKEEYEKRLAAFKESEAEKDKKVSLRCESCNKHFSSNNALENHLKSKKHLDVEARKPKKSPRKEIKPSTSDQKPITEPAANDVSDNDDDWEDDDEEGEWESCDENDDEGGKRIIIDTNDCLFCDNVSDSTESNVSHMTSAHSFFIPDIEYLTDLDALIGTLAAKIHMDHICLWCNGKGRGFKSVKSVKQHMTDKGHCKMLHEGEALLDYADLYDYSKVESEDEPVDVAEMDELLSDADYELVLPSGATVGHRSLSLYYKQNLKPVQSNSKQKVKKVLQYYQSIGYTATTAKIAAKKARDISYVKRVKDRYNLKLGMKQNKLLQPHFRHQIMF
uniref:Zinc finger protein 622 n=1 Tax=Parasteatoda tepidariorum TaxID=114398 RepID=A0A2L2Y1E3_PARTP